jgi:hypothetical protein
MRKCLRNDSSREFKQRFFAANRASLCFGNAFGWFVRHGRRRWVFKNQEAQ